MDLILNLLKQRRAQILIIALLTFLAYSNIFQNQLVLDDKSFITDWEQIRNVNNLPALLKGDLPEIHKGVYRPVRSVLYLIYYQIWGQNPMGYHLHALLVHLVSTILVFLILERLVKNRLAVFIGGMLFGLHPIHTESITYIAASMEMTGVAFFLVSFYFYLRSGSCRSASLASLVLARNNFAAGARWGIPLPVTPHFLLIISIIFSFLAFFTYEMTLTLPLLILLYELCFNRKKIAQTVKWYIPYLIAVGSFVLVRVGVLGIGGSRGNYLGYSFYHTMLTMAKMVVLYIWLLINPTNLSYIHEVAPGFESFMTKYSNIQSILSRSILDLDIILSVLLIVALIVVGFKLVKKMPLVSFGIGWFFISLLPVLYILPQGIAIAEKYLYIPSFGFILIVTTILNYFLNLKKNNNLTQYVSLDNLKKVILSLILLLIFIYGTSTYLRNNDWKDPITFWTKIAQQHPQSSLANYTLGVLYGDQNNLEKAQEYYLKAADLEPRFWEARFNLANIYKKEGKLELAQEQYNQVSAINPDLAQKQVAPIGTNWIEYKSKVLSFSYPSEWKVRDMGNVLSLACRQAGIKGEDDFIMEMLQDKRVADLSIDEYLKIQKDDYGNLVNQGLAQIPGVDSAYVKVWEDQKIQKLQFFLFKGDKVVKILVYPANSPLMKTFDQIVESLKID